MGRGSPRLPDRCDFGSARLAYQDFRDMIAAALLRQEFELGARLPAAGVRRPDRRIRDDQPHIRPKLSA